MLILATFQVAALTQVTASIDKNPAVLKESIVLTIVADDDVEANALDTSVLLKDFIVGRTQISRQTSSINFKTSRTTTWTTLLIPKRSGKIHIPALAVEGEYTSPIALVVLDKADPEAQQQQDIFITAEVSSDNIYVQQMFTFKVKLHFAVELKRANLSLPEMQGATIAQMGEDQTSDDIINGRRFRVIERTFAVTPQQSGQFTLKSPLLNGEVLIQSNGNRGFFNFGETKPISVSGDEFAINVKAIPEQFDGHWLPSEILTVHDEWQPNNMEFTVGEPITRTITLTAAAVSAEQLPELELVLPNGLKVYPDQPEPHSGTNSGRLISQVKRNFAIVATKPGTYQIPALSIPWWNTVTNRLETAKIEPITIKVSANANQQANINDTAQLAPEQIAAPLTTTQPTQVVVSQTSWLTWLFLALWLLTTLAWFISSRLNKKQPYKPTAATINNQQVHLALMAACKQHDGKQAMSLIIPWAKQHYQGDLPVNTIDQAKTQLNNKHFSKAVDTLYQCFYGVSQENMTWQGNELLSAIIEVHQQTASKAVTELVINP